jgi:ABC-2 type transport system permease protein
VQLIVEVPLRDGLFSPVVATMLLLGTEGLGPLVSTYAVTQQQTMMATAFLIMPVIVRSGFAFPIRNMPEPLQWLSFGDPLRCYLVVIRDLVLKVNSVFDHPFELAMMAGLGLSALTIATLRVR